MMPAEPQRTFKLANETGSLGLSCTQEGVALAEVPLLRRIRNGFAPRPPAEVWRLVSRAYGIDADVARLMKGPEAVARALNAGEMSRAMIAAVQLKLPALDWHGAVRIAQAEVGLAKYDPNEPRDRRRRWTTGSNSAIDAATEPIAIATDAAPLAGPAASATAFRIPSSAANDGAQGAKQPASATTAVGSVPSAPSGASTQDRVHLPPGKRIDELGDLLEWIANAKPEDEPVIRAEIKRLYYDAGDTRGGEALNRALSEALYYGPLERKDREELLAAYEPYTRVDPAEIGRFTRDLASLGLLAPLRSVPAPIEAAPSEVWQLGWAARGRAIEKVLGGNLPSNFPVIDRLLMVSRRASNPSI